MSLDDVRKRTLSTALDMVNSQGLTVSLQHIPFDDIIALAGVARSAAYRVWASRDDFFEDLLLHLVTEPNLARPSAFDDDTLFAVLEWIEREWHNDPLFLSNAERRKQALTEICRIGASVNFQSIMQHESWRTYLALSATALSYDEPMRSHLMAGIEASESMYITGMAKFYEIVGKLLGRRQRPAFTAEYMAATGSALMEGMALRGGTTGTGKLVPDIGQPSADSDPFEVELYRPWNAPALAFTAMLFAMTEPIPEGEYQEVSLQNQFDAAKQLAKALSELTKAAADTDVQQRRDEDTAESDRDQEKAEIIEHAVERANAARANLEKIAT